MSPVFAFQMPTMAIQTNYAKFNWFPSGLPVYLNLVPAILQLVVVQSNIFVVAVFLGKKMYFGINVILIGMAIADAASVTLLMVSYWFALVLHNHSSGSFTENQVHFLCVTYKYVERLHHVQHGLNMANGVSGSCEIFTGAFSIAG